MRLLLLILLALLLGGSDMGWIPVGTSVLDGAVTTNGLVNAAPDTPYANKPQAVYDPVADRTVLTFLGEDRDLYVTYWDHQTNATVTPIKIDDRILAANDNHSAPSIEVDLDGHYHIVWGSHSTAHIHLKSDNPHNISAWTDQTLSGLGTYPFIICNPDSGDLFIVDRAASGTGDNHGSTFPAHEFAAIRKSTDGGATWSSAAAIVDLTGHPDNKADFYPGGVEFGPDGFMHLVWLVAHGATHDATRENIYHAKYDPTDGTLYTVDGTSLGSVVTWADHSSIQVITATPVSNSQLVFDGDRIVVSAGVPGGTARVAVWDGSSWTETNTGIVLASAVAYVTVYPVDDALRLVAGVDNGQIDLELYGGSIDGSRWVKLATLLTETSGEGWARVNRVKNYRNLVAITQEAAALFVPTNATLSDLLPVVGLFDEAAVTNGSGSGLIGTHDHDADYAVISHTHGADLHRLVVLVDNGAGGVEPLTDDNDLWLYGAYPGTEH